MKKHILGWLVISLLLLPTVALGDPKNKNTKPDKEKAIEKKDLKPFNAVSLSGIGNLHIKQSEQQNFTIEGDASVVPLVVVYVKDKTLYIDVKEASEHQKAKIDYYLNIKDLQKIESFSASTIFIPDGFQSNALTLSLNSFSEADIKVNVKKFVINVNGGSKANVRGIAPEQEIHISGAGEFNGSKLVGNKALLNINGSGIAKTNVSTNLFIKVNGEGQIKYCGKPTIQREISGKTTITSLYEAECQ